MRWPWQRQQTTILDATVPRQSASSDEVRVVRTYPPEDVNASEVDAEAVQAVWDAAQTTDENKRHWANADNLSANAAVSPTVRQVLRSRSRYECGSNSYASGIVSTLTHDTVGTGPRVQFLSENDDCNNAVEKSLSDWSAEVNLPHLLSLAREAKAVSGEVFILLKTDRTMKHPVKLRPVLIEADQVTTPDLFIEDSRHIDGVRYDANGNPTHYSIMKDHPGELYSNTWDYEWVEAKYIIHYAHLLRPTQRRGVPELTPALPLFAQLRRYTLAVLSAAESAANFATYLCAPLVPDAMKFTEGKSFRQLEIARNMLTVAPVGYKPEQLKAEQPTTTYAEFKSEILCEIARCLGMPYNIAAGKSSEYNYASGRLDHQTYFRKLRDERRMIDIVILEPLIRAWLREAAFVVRELWEYPDITELAWRSLWPGHGHVDPVKEADAQATRLANDATSLVEECAREGRDWREVLIEKAAVLKFKKQLGLLDEEPPGKSPTDNRKDDNDDKDE